MDRLEEMIRESLEARSQDVEPTPALWDRVDRRIGRRRWMAVGAWAVGTAAAVLVAAVVVPGLLQQPTQPDIADQPPTGAVPTAEPSTVATEAPTRGPTERPTSATGSGTEAPADAGSRPMLGDADGDLLPDAYVAIEDGNRLTVRDSRTDEVLRELRPAVEFADGAFEAVAVRPGSTVEDLVLAVSYIGEGSEEVRVLDYSGDQEIMKVMGVREHDLVERPRRTLAWDELGEHLAWTFPDGLHVATLEDLRRARPLPGTAGNDVSHVFELEGVSYDQVWDWTWVAAADETNADGRLVLRGLDGWVGVVVDRAPDGTLAGVTARDRVTEDLPGASSHRWPETADGSPLLSLSVVDGQLEVSWSGDGDQRASVPLGGDLTATDEVWLEANSGGVLVGKRDGVWLSHADFDPASGADTTRQLPAPIQHAAFVPVIRDEVRSAVPSWPGN